MRIIDRGADVDFFSQYDPVLIQRLKIDIPPSGRKPIYHNGRFSHWVINKQYLTQLESITGKSFSHLKTAVNTTPSTKLFRVEYIGQIKDRGGEMSAMGLIDSNWSIVFPENVLKSWFTGKDDNLNISTFYTTLNVKQSASDREIKSAWRKMLRRYHPDINKDNDADDMTIKINDAYNILRNPQKRKKYDAGLKLQLLATRSKDYSAFGKTSNFTIPIRCGMILCKCIQSAGRNLVDEILEWVDIVENGKTLITSWDKQLNQIKREWI
jgi:DnaJ-domain-containing protein 1